MRTLRLRQRVAIAAAVLVASTLAPTTTALAAAAPSPAAHVDPNLIVVSILAVSDPPPVALAGGIRIGGTVRRPRALGGDCVGFLLVHG